MFNRLPKAKLDALVRVGQLLRADNRPEKLDLGVGVYRDAEGLTPVLGVVKIAEQELNNFQTSKSYLPPDGDPDFIKMMIDLVLSKNAPELAAAQAPGGTGAFHQALALIKATGRNARIWVGTPTWPNHIPMIDHGGLRYQTYAYYDIGTQSPCFEILVNAMERADRGDLFLLHGCCHNPTGSDLSREQWREIADVMQKKGLIALIDFAYQGFGFGCDEDALGVRLLAASLPHVIIAASCSKSFSLYQERTGIIIVKCETAAEAEKVQSALQSLARLNYSNPPGHGAAIVRTILASPTLRAQWLSELASMRDSVTGIRNQLAMMENAAEQDLQWLVNGNGLFATFAMTPAQCERMGSEFAIHMPDTGRINIAGLTQESVERFAMALKSVKEVHCSPSAPMAQI